MMCHSAQLILFLHLELHDHLTVITKNPINCFSCMTLLNGSCGTGSPNRQSYGPFDDFQIFGKRKWHCGKQGSVIFYLLIMFQMFAECFLVLLELANLKAISIIHMLFLEKEPFLWTRLAPPNR